MADTKIEWAQKVWNPVTGCTPISEGCQHCYAKRMAPRLKGRYGYPGDDPFRVTLHEDRLKEPGKWKKPRRIFVCSMADLFHDDVPDEFIDRVWDIMWAHSRHTFIVLTKRVERMVNYVRKRAYRTGFGWTQRDSTFIVPGEFNHYENITMRNECGYLDTSERENEDSDIDWLCTKSGEECDDGDCPVAYRVDEREDLEKIGVADQYTYDSEGYAEDCQWMKYHTRPKYAGAGNVWLGFTAENQERYEERIRLFRGLRDKLGPYAVLFCSLEPLLSPIDFKIKYWPQNEGGPNWSPFTPRDYSDGGGKLAVPVLNWIIAGGETGLGARPMHPDWVRSIRDECRAVGLPFFFKGWGEWAPNCLCDSKLPHRIIDRPQPGKMGCMFRCGKKAAGRLFEGREWNEFPT